MGKHGKQRRKNDHGKKEAHTKEAGSKTPLWEYPALVGICLVIAAMLLGPAVMGTLLFRSGWKDYREMSTRQGWPTTTGKVTTSDVGVEGSVIMSSGVGSSGVGHSKSVGVSHRSTRTSWVPKIHYQYEVGGRAYTGSRIRPDIQVMYDSAAEAENAAKAYPVGKEVRVYYDPKNPGQCVLQPGDASSSMMKLIGGVGAAMLSLWMIVAYGLDAFWLEERWEKRMVALSSARPGRAARR